MTPRSVAFLTVGRSDWGILRPIVRAARAEPRLAVRLLVSGAHLAAGRGAAAPGELEAAGAPLERVEVPPSADTPAGVAEVMGRGTVAFAAHLARGAPDLLVVVGDRFETHAAVVAAVPFGLPVVHLHGGELTLGAFDDALRHSITKLSHLHLVSAEEHARRVVQLGEEPWRVSVVGAPGLDELLHGPRLDAGALARELGVRVEPAPVLVTFHPTTRELERTGWQVDELLAALEGCPSPLLFTLPNADPNGGRIRAAIEAFAARRPAVQVVETLGRGYSGVLARAAAMVGNSSSGLIEAPAFGLPVVNVGTRQEGRLRARNVIDVGDDRSSIVEGLRRALDPTFREGLAGLRSPFGDGRAAPRVVARLAEVPLDARLRRKGFADLPAPDAWRPLAPWT